MSETPLYQGGGTVPIPDPTVLTSAALAREIGALREMLLAENRAVREVFETRLKAMDQAIVLLQATADRSPTLIDEKIAALREIQEEKFRSIQVQFSERDTRAEQSGIAARTAVDAALSAAKEANAEQNKSSSTSIAKSEAATMKQIDGINALIQAVVKAADDKMADAKERLTRLEGRREGGAERTQSQQSAVGTWVPVLFGVISLVIAAAALLIRFTPK